MPALDFSEIPEANKGTGMQDTFELFARDFLAHVGYAIIQGPDRGQDGGKDIIIKEIRKGIGGESEIRWLVSCKHKAHSGSSVGVNDEIDIPGRVAAHGCNGYIGFFSTLPSSGLTTQLEGLKSRFDYQIYDREKIEKDLLGSSEGLKLAKRYFPKSIAEYIKNNPKPEKFFWKYPELTCEYCGNNLLEPKKTGIVVIWTRMDDTNKDDNSDDEIVSIYTSCKGHCDNVLNHKYFSTHKDVVDGWEDIPDICIPTVYAKWMYLTFDELYGKAKYSKEAFDKIKDIMLAIFPYISRELTDEEKEDIKSLTKLPSYLGGLG